MTDPDFMSVNTILTGFVDRLSKNGNTLLNVGPKPDGIIPEAATVRLLEIGDWLEMNREVVTGSRPGWTFGKGPTNVTASRFEEASSVTFTGGDVRFLRTDERTAVIALEWPADGRLDLATSLGQVYSRWTYRQPPIERSLSSGPRTSTSGGR